MMNQNNIKSSSFNVGDDLIIKLKYLLNDQNLLKSNLQVKISINNSTQTEVLNLNNEVSGYIHILNNKEGYIVCKIPHIPLGEGRYSINIEAIINSGAADVINNVGSFEVIPGDYFGTGVANNTKANFYCISEWE